MSPADKITEILSEGARLIKRAPRYPVFMLMLLEALVIDVGHATGWRIWAWAKLVKVWASLRWSDLQAIIPAELSLVEGRLTTVLRRTKTSGPSRRVKELPVAISEHAYFLRSTWLRVGFDLLRTHANYKRDYLLPRLNQDGLLEKKPASYADAWWRRRDCWAFWGYRWRCRATGPSIARGPCCRPACR